MGAVHAPGSMVLLTRLAKVVYRRSGEDLLGMRLRHFVTLSYVNDHDGASQQALGEALCMDANNLVLLLNELEAAGTSSVAAIPMTAAVTSSTSPRTAGRRSSAASAPRRASRTRCSRR